MNSLKLQISSAPHIRDKDNTYSIMSDVVIALIPATAFGIYLFGLHAGILVATCIISSVLFELLYQRFMKKDVTILDFSAVVTGLLLAINLPPDLPIWMAIIGSAFAIIIVKQLFGGLGQNFMNPALAARCFLVISFTGRMTTFVYDGVTQATPLTVLKAGGNVDISDMFFGFTGGTIGETSVLALLVGAGYLLIKKVISPKIPLIYIGSFAAFIAIYAITKDLDVMRFTLEHLCGGGLMLGAWFMATDYATSPITSKGKIIYGIMLGLLTFVLRIYGGSAEGVSYAIIISNLFVPLIELVTKPKSFGSKAKKISEMADGAGESIDTKGITKAITTITIIALVMGGLLGTVYNLTKEPINKVNEQAKADAYKDVYPELDTIKSYESDLDELDQMLSASGHSQTTVSEINTVIDNSGQEIGYIIIVTNKDGYSGDIEMCIGISNEIEVKGVSFLTINETVGLGMEADKSEFKNQFVGMKVDEIIYSKTGATLENEIDALSGATITTSAIVDGVNSAIEISNYIVGGGANE